MKKNKRIKIYSISDHARAIAHAFPPVILFGIAASLTLHPVIPLLCIGNMLWQLSRHNKRRSRIISTLKQLADEIQIPATRKEENLKKFINTRSNRLGITPPEIYVISSAFMQKATENIKKTQNPEARIAKQAILDLCDKYHDDPLNDAACCMVGKSGIIIISHYSVHRNKPKIVKAIASHELGHLASRTTKIRDLVEGAYTASELTALCNITCGCMVTYGGLSLFGVPAVWTLQALTYIAIIFASIGAKKFALPAMGRSQEYLSDKIAVGISSNAKALPERIAKWKREKEDVLKALIEFFDIFEKPPTLWEKGKELIDDWQKIHPLPSKRLARLKRMKVLKQELV